MRLTKHTTTSITAASPSIYTPIGNEPPCPRSIQFNENAMGTPPPGTIPATNKRAKTEKTSEMVTPSMATYWAFSLRRRPVRTSTRKTSAGRVGMAVMISCWPTVCTGSLLAPHGGYFVDVHCPPRAEHGEHYREANSNLGRGYGDHEHGVADAETSGVREVVGKGDKRVEKLLYLGRDLGHYSRTPLSTPSPILRRLTTMAATTATRSSTDATSYSRVKISAPWLTPSRSLPKAPTCRGPLPASVPPQSSAESK